MNKILEDIFKYRVSLGDWIAQSPEYKDLVEDAQRVFDMHYIDVRNFEDFLRNLTGDKI